MSKPSFKALFEEYAAELGNRNADSIPKFVSPNVELHFNGEQKEVGVDSLQSFFTTEWARRDANVKVLDVVELPGKDAVQVKAFDHADADNVVTTTYHYAKHGGKWVIVKLDTGYGYWN